MQMNGGSDGGYQSDINVTPLVDVVLVLLIIFMVVVPLTLRGYEVAIPEAAARSLASAEPDHEQIVLGVDAVGCEMLEPPASDGLPADCSVRVNDDTVPVAELAGHIARIFAVRPDSERVLFLAAQDRLNYEAVMRIVDVARSRVHGLRIGLVTSG